MVQPPGYIPRTDVRTGMTCNPFNVSIQGLAAISELIMGLSDSESTLDAVTESDRQRSSQHQMETTGENHENWGVFQSFYTWI